MKTNLATTRDLLPMVYAQKMREINATSRLIWRGRAWTEPQGSALDPDESDPSHGRI